ncbi:MAG: transporter [bacterium]|nr:transporter [bacterium]
MMPKIGWGLVFLLFSGLVGFAGAEELVTDRPDQTESAEVVPRNAVQFEVGWTHAEDGDGDDTTADSFPETLVRVGLAERWELRLGYDGYRWTEADTPGGSVDTDGSADASVGFKVGLFDENGRRPQGALIASLGLPVGDEEFTTDRADPSFRLALANGLTERLSLGYNLGAAWQTVTDSSGDRDTFSRLEWTVALGISGGERFGYYVELFGDAALSDSGGPANAFDGGVTWLVRDNVQLDAAAGVGLSDEAGDWYAGLGISFRVPR